MIIPHPARTLTRHILIGHPADLVLDAHNEAAVYADPQAHG
jgi:hypothetical protein